MKRLFVIGSLFLIILTAKAQDPLFLEGDKRLNLGIGLSKYPVASVSLDYGVVDGIAEKGAIGIGAYAGFGANADYAFSSLGVRGTFHYPVVDDLDTYIGVAVGMRYDASSYYSNEFNGIPGFFVGANYPIGRNILLFGEAGSGLSYLTGGISLIID